MIKTKVIKIKRGRKEKRMKLRQVTLNYLWLNLKNIQTRVICIQIFIMQILI